MTETEILSFCRDNKCKIAFYPLQVLVSKHGANFVYSVEYVSTHPLDQVLHEAINRLNQEKKEAQNDGQT